MKEYPEDGHKLSRLRGRQARLAKLVLEHLLPTKANRPFKALLAKRVNATLAAACYPLQALARRNGAKAYVMSLRAAAEEMRRVRARHLAATVIASKLYRRYKGRAEGLRLARGFIVKLYEPSHPNDPYWWSKVRPPNSPPRKRKRHFAHRKRAMWDSFDL